MTTDPTVPASASGTPAPQRKGLVLELAELFVLPNHHRRQDLAIFETLMSSLFGNAPLTERKRAAELLADRPDVPAAIAALIGNAEIEVAQPILSRSSALATIDRIRIIANRSEAHRVALATRADLEEATISALIVHGGAETIATLAGNTGLQLTTTQSDHLRDRAIVEGQPLAQLPRTPGIGIGASVDLFFDLGAEERRRVLAAFDAETAFRRIEKRGRRTPPAQRPGLNRRLIEAVFAGDVETYATLLAEHLGIDLALTHRIVADRGGEPLVIALIACGLDATDATSIFVRSDPSLGWTYQTIRHLVQLYNAVGWRTAEAVLARWSGAARTTGTVRASGAADRIRERETGAARPARPGTLAPPNAHRNTT